MDASFASYIHSDLVEQVPIPLRFEGLEIDIAFRADLVVEGKVLVELKAVEQLGRLHEAQVLTYLKLSGIRVGLPLNFNVTRLRSGIQRVVL